MTTGNICPQCGFSNQEHAKFCAECGQALINESPVQPTSAPQNVGKVLQGRYRIEQELGRGGFGAVYRAWDGNLSRWCAVKENLETSPEAHRQFGREATVLANLNHPNLPRVTDHFFIPDQGQYLVMDFIEGEDIASKVRRQGTIPLNQALDWIVQVSEALEYLHTQQPPIFHRDIKPANIRITPKGQAVLVDFGLVKVSAPHMKTTVGARAITPGYAPPEQYGRGTTDSRTDVYALGATLYNLLTGSEPPESVQRLSGGIMRPTHQLNPQVPFSVSKAIERAMAVDPVQRFQSAAEFRGALLDSSRVVRPTPPTVLATPQVRSSVQTATSSPQMVVPYSGARVDRSVSVPAYPSQAVRKGGGSKMILIAVLAGMFVLVVGIATILGGLAFVRGQESAKLTSTAAHEATLAAWVRSTATSQAQSTGTAQANLEATAQVIQATETAKWAATATEQAMLQATAEAQAALTAAVQAAIQATEQARDSLVNSLLAARTRIFGPESGSLDHVEDGYIQTYDTAAKQANFVVEAKFFNPFSVAVGTFDFGFLLRDSGESNQQIRLVIKSDKTWELTNHDGQSDGVVANDGTIPWLDISATGSNTVLVICQGDRGFLYVNDQFVSELDLSARMSSGEVRIGTGFYTGHEINGETTRFEGFTVWSLP